ncbi:2404_t:CDS:2 [Entrophospora sp. SA101]|nr:2404_t:CDS:2 [Entrophospora sp. SA101]
MSRVDNVSAYEKGSPKSVEFSDVNVARATIISANTGHTFAKLLNEPIPVIAKASVVPTTTGSGEKEATASVAGYDN